MTSPTEHTEDAERIARRIELTVGRRLDGLLRGDYLGILPGPGWEVGEARPYAAGDDVRRIDWSLTARADEVYVRDTIVERELESTIVVDLSPSINFGTAHYEKRDLALAAAAVVGFLSVRTGGRVGLVALEPRSTVFVPARTGRQHVVAVLERLGALRPPDCSGRADLAAGLRAAGRLARRRGLACVISDFLQEDGWERDLRALARRHQVLAVEVLDPRELELPNVGEVALVDPASGRRLTVSTASSELRERYADAAAEQRRRVASRVRAAGAAHLVLRTDRDWVLDIVRFAHGRRRHGSGLGDGR